MKFMITVAMMPGVEATTVLTSMLQDLAMAEELTRRLLPVPILRKKAQNLATMSVITR